MTMTDQVVQTADADALKCEVPHCDEKAFNLYGDEETGVFRVCLKHRNKIAGMPVFKTAAVAFGLLGREGSTPTPKPPAAAKEGGSSPEKKKRKKRKPKEAKETKAAAKPDIGEWLDSFDDRLLVDETGLEATPWELVLLDVDLGVRVSRRYVHEAFGYVTEVAVERKQLDLHGGSAWAIMAKTRSNHIGANAVTDTFYRTLFAVACAKEPPYGLPRWLLTFPSEG